jgi:Domain of unknown function (DUF6438)
MRHREDRVHPQRKRSHAKPPDWFDRNALGIMAGALLIALAAMALQLWLMRAAPDADAVAAARKIDLAGFEVYLHRQGCPTRCPVYAVLVRGDGTVQFEGVELVARVGTERSTVTELETRALALAVLRSGLATAPAQFKPGAALCERWLPGRELVRIAAKLGGQSWAVDYYPGCQPGDPKLEQLAREIDALANTARWVKAG